MPLTPSERAARRAVVVASAALLVPVVIGLLFGAILKSLNPDDVDVSQGLAYLRPILIVSWTLIAVCLAASVALNAVTGIRHGRPAATTAWIVLGVQVVLGLALLAAQGLTDAAQGA